MKGALLRVSVCISEQAADPVVAILENVFGRAPSVYTNAESRATTASIFLDKSSQWNPSVKTKLLNGLKMIRDESGIEIGSGKIIVKKLPREDWAESWKKHFKPIEIGNALLIKPSWSRQRPLKSQACVVLDPGLSFGTGQHATTLFCLEQMVRCRRLNQPQSFLDIGTGSGILAISAAKLGYFPVYAFDFDPEAVRISQNNAEQNGVGNQVRPVRRDLTQISLQSKTRFDLICANLIYDLLLSEREKIVNRLDRSGSLILAGILKTQFAQVKTAYEKMGMTLKESKVGKEWRSGRFVF
ncbi:MAG: 50S ribosomal protein L11 methyltransferase [Verrucomicrobiota bacterium]